MSEPRIPAVGTPADAPAWYQFYSEVLDELIDLRAELETLKATVEAEHP